MRQLDPRRRSVECFAISAPENRIHKFGFGWAGELFRQRDRFVDGGVRRDFIEEAKLVETKVQNVGHDRPRRPAGELAEQKIEREPVPQTTVEKFLHKRAVAGWDGVLFREQLVGQPPRVRPRGQKFDCELPGIHTGRLTWRGCDRK